MSYTLSPSQLETLVFDVAQAAGLDTQDCPLCAAGLPLQDRAG